MKKQQEACCQDCEQLSTEELAEHNNILLNALIDVLIKKKLLTEKDLKEQLEAGYGPE